MRKKEGWGVFAKKIESKSATKPHFANRSAVVVFSASGKCFSDEEIGEVSVTFMGLSFSSPSSSSQLGFSSTQLEINFGCTHRNTKPRLHCN